jgi:hypothetical protein
VRLNKKLAAIAITATVALTTTAAFAFWSSSGSGDGTATAGSASSVTVNQTSIVSAMGPGVDAQTLSGTFTVAKPSYVGQVSASVTGTTHLVGGVQVANAGCTSADFTVVNPTATNAEISTGSTWSGGSIVFKDSASNQDACQGATALIHYTSN